MGASNSFRVWLKTLLRLAEETPHAIAQHMRDKRENRVVLARVILIVTTRCTLNCDKCMACIPDLKAHEDVPLCDLLEDLRSLFSCVDYIYSLIISGGEVFLHPQLDEIIRACSDVRKVGSITLDTNGTVIPGREVLLSLREAKTLVQISRYPSALQPEVERLKSVFSANNIPYTHESAAFWRDTGVLGQQQEGSKQNNKFSACYLQLCMPFYRGKLHLCSKTPALMEIGALTGCEEDYIDLRRTSPERIGGELTQLRKKRAVAACAYCQGIYNAPRVPVAKQREQ